MNKISTFVCNYKIEVKPTKKALKDEEKTDFIVPISMVGPKDCGKTAILEKITRERENSAPKVSSGLEDYKFIVPLIVPFDNVICQPYAYLSVTKASGDERYATFWKSTLSSSAILIVVYDCQTEGSLEESLGFVDMYEEEKRWNHMMIVLMASKADPRIQPVVEFSRAKAYADERGWLFFKVSSRYQSREKLIEKFSKIATAAVERWWTKPEGLWDNFIESPHYLYKYIS